MRAQIMWSWNVLLQNGYGMHNKLENLILWRQKYIGFAGVLMMCFQKVKVMHLIKSLVVVFHKDWWVVCIRKAGVLVPNDRDATGLICWIEGEKERWAQHWAREGWSTDLEALCMSTCIHMECWNGCCAFPMRLGCSWIFVLACASLYRL